MKRSVQSSPITERLAALSDLLRLRACRLLELEELSVGELARVLQVPQSTASRHLKVLIDADWLERRADGTAAFYRLKLRDPADTALWGAVRAGLDGEPQAAEDRRRLAGVVAERRVDSLSFFGRLAGDWDQVRAELFGDRFGYQALLGLLPGEWAVADVGCGTGANAASIAPFVRSVVCVDQSAPMLAAARERLAGVPNVRFEQGPLEALPLEDACVDAALCVLVLHYLDRPVDGLRELRRVVRPGGKALIVDMYPHDRAVYRQTMGHKHLGLSPEGLEQMCRGAGFSGVRVTPLPSEPDARGPGLYVACAA